MKSGNWSVLFVMKEKLGPQGGYLHPILRINAFCDQSGDHARILVDKRTVDLMETCIGDIPDAGATWLYLKALQCVVLPFEDPAFGDVYQLQEAIWTGVYIFRLQRAFVICSPELKLGEHSSSTEMFTTIEGMAHGAVCHHLTAKKHFPNKS